MSKRNISTVTFMPAVESVSRKWARRSDTCSEKKNQQGQTHTTTYFGSGVRQKNFKGGLISQNYVFIRLKSRMTPVSADEISVRTNFASASKWAKEAVTNMSAVTHNQQVYIDSKESHTRSQGVWAGDYSFRGFCFAVAMAMLGNGMELPANYQLPEAA